MEQFLKYLFYFKQSLPEIIYFKNTPAPPPPWRLNGGPLKAKVDAIKCASSQ